MKKKILLIEDEQQMNYRFIYKLKEIFEVEIAISAEAAVNLLSQKKDFDLIFLDIMMDPRPYSFAQTDEGIETGWILYEQLLRNFCGKVVVWSKNRDIFKKPWGSNVVEKVIKSNDENQLIQIARRQLGE